MIFAVDNHCKKRYYYLTIIVIVMQSMVDVFAMSRFRAKSGYLAILLAGNEIHDIANVSELAVAICDAQ